MNEENKRKAIILTFIGALTLLFVVIGGTYAYFQIVNTSEGSTSTDFNAQTDNLNKYGTPLLTKKSDLYINLSASDMAYSKGGTSYWATEKKEPQEKNYEEERKNHVISTASIESPDIEDAVEDAYLSCTSELTITIDGTMKDVLETGDGTLYLGTSASGKNKGSIEPESFDLAELVSKQASGENKATVNYTIVGYTSVDVTADVEIINKSDKSQNVLAGTDIQITITNNNLSCSVSEKPKPIYAKLDNASNYQNCSTYACGTLYRSNEYQTKIVNASFVDYIPSEEELRSKPKYWDLSDTESGTPSKSVIGWLEPNKETSTNYDLYIGSNSEIYVKDLSNTFESMINLEKVDLGNLNTSETTDMRSMFSGNTSNMKISEIKGLEKFDTSKVTNMTNMFMGCVSLETINLSNFNTSKVTDMSNMFAGAQGGSRDGLNATITFPQNFGSAATNMAQMFASYQGTTLDLSNFDTSQVTDMHGMFSKCSNLTTLDLSSFTFDNVTTDGEYDTGNYRTFYNVPSSCQVKIKSSQQEIFESKFPLGTGTYDRKFTPTYID